MFVPLWVIFLSTGLIMAVVTVLWASRSRQFEDQHRARFIPLAGLSAEEIAYQPDKNFRAERVGVFALLLVGLAALLAGLMLAIRHM